MLIWDSEGPSTWKFKFPTPNLQKSWVKLFPAGLESLDVVGLLNILLISAGNRLTAVRQMFLMVAPPVGQKNEEGVKQTHV